MHGHKALAALLLIEVAVFAVFGQNFFSTANAAEMVRLGVEVGLLALALTCVIVTGGIDLSCGPMMGLTAVVFGMSISEWRWPLPLAITLALAVGLGGGLLNAWLIARWGRLPLIVTLGTYSLFRGIAEGLTGGVRSYNEFPRGFLAFGQGMQAPVFLLGAIAAWVLLERSTWGRGLYAIGHTEAGARYAGIPVARRLTLVYGISGVVASVAGLIYVARIGQAKADAGTGYELAAITAVVLGGTSIFGGRGSIAGTVLGLASIIVLQVGLRLAGMPAELAGILTGILLISVMTADVLSRRPRRTVLVGAILAGALILAVSGWWVVKALRPAAATAKKTVVAMMPKAKGDPYFISCRKGAAQAAQELGVDLIWDGPTDLDPARQNEIAESFITRGVDVIAVAVNNQAAISTVLRKARASGIKVLTWDADSAPDARDFLINQATPQAIGETLADEAARLLGGRGEFAVITGALTAANQNEWIVHIKRRIAGKHPNLKLVAIRPSDDDRDKAFAEAQTLMKVYPSMKVIVGIAAPAVPGAAEAVKQSQRTDVKVTGLSLPNLCKPYVHAGIIDSVVLWNTLDLGYLTVLAADQLSKGTLKSGATSMNAGRLGTKEIRGTEVILGAPFIFTKANIDNFDF